MKALKLSLSPTERQKSHVIRGFQIRVE